MRVAVCTVSLPEWTPEEAVGVLAGLGCDGVEWRVTDQAAWDGEPGFWFGNRCTLPLATFVEDAPRVRAFTEAAGLAVPNVGAYASCHDLDAVERVLRGAALLGAPCARVTLPDYDGREPYLPVRDRAREAFREVARLARAHGVRALLELHMDTIVPSASAAAAFLDGFDPADVGVIHDAGNFVFEGYERYRLGLDVLGPYLAHVHLKNARWVAGDRRPDGTTAWHAVFAPLAQGAVDVRSLLDALAGAGYDGWISLEDFSTDRPLLDRLRDGLAFVAAAGAPEPS